ncbi:hypothetical protein EJB05_17001, partial [Eragrostis curvula]
MSGYLLTLPPAPSFFLSSPHPRQTNLSSATANNPARSVKATTLAEVARAGDWRANKLSAWTSIRQERARERSRLLAIASAGDANKSPGKRTAAGGIDQVSSRSIAQEENVGLSFPHAGRKHRQRQLTNNGTYLRNGAGVWEVGDSAFDHLFDGYAMLVRVSFRQGRATGAHRQIESDAYKAAKAHGRPLHREFAYCPKPANLIHRVRNVVGLITGTATTDNPNVSCGAAR